MHACLSLALACGAALALSVFACSSSTNPPLVASGGNLSAGGSTPELPPCNMTQEDAGDQNGAFIDATADSAPQGTLNPTTPSDGGALLVADTGAGAGVDASNPCH